MSILSDTTTRLRNACDRSLSGEQRIFSALEAVFMPVSFLTILGLIAVVILKRCGVSIPHGVESYALPVLVSAAIGYLTNWIAIEMLFKPYERTWRHPFAWISFGYWRQGLVPKNKNRIAEVMGEQVAERLLQPEKLADDLCNMVGGVLQNREVLSSIQNGLQHQIEAHDQEIIDFLVPKIETALTSEIDRLVTVENIESFWNDVIEPRLQSSETREEIARMIIGALDKRASDMARKVRPLLVDAIRRWVEEKGGMLGGLLSPLAGTLADWIIDKDTIEKGLREWLESPDTVPMLRNELMHYVKAMRDYLSSAEAKAKVGGFVDDIRGRFKEYLRNYLQTHLADTARGFLRSEALWQYVADLIPQFQPELERLIREQGMPLIIEKLDIQGRIQTAVDGMDMAEFHGMVNEVGAQHLGAIQVLGYILGALAGGLMLLAR